MIVHLISSLAISDYHDRQIRFITLTDGGLNLFYKNKSSYDISYDDLRTVSIKGEIYPRGVSFFIIFETSENKYEIYSYNFRSILKLIRVLRSKGIHLEYNSLKVQQYCEQ